jgi:hypothetical protein
MIWLLLLEQTRLRPLPGYLSPDEAKRASRVASQQGDDID